MKEERGTMKEIKSFCFPFMVPRYAFIICFLCAPSVLSVSLW
jgi:hypothetical protein